MAVLDIILNGIFTGIGTGIGVIIAELYMRDKIKDYPKKLKNIRDHLLYDNLRDNNG
jgi:Na+-driven multidrug efflux pump